MRDNTRASSRWWSSGAIVVGILSAGAQVAWADPDGPPALEGPATSAELIPENSGDSGGATVLPSRVVNVAPTHEAFRASGVNNNVERVRAPKSPPPPIVERPTDDRPNDQAQWVAGYWTWDASIHDFAWVSGAWRVPPADSIWVNGRWQRDAEGWSRVPGFWSPRRAPALNSQAASPEITDWRTKGPPTTHPADDPGPAPEPDAFFVPGHYVPDGDRVVWKNGFWARSQPGWDWLPARWIRRPTGWDYRQGSWVRETDPNVLQATRHTVARPAAETSAVLPPAIVESEPVNPSATTPSRDPIAETEEANQAARDAAQNQVNPPVVLIPRAGVYGYPGANPYGPYPYGGYPGPTGAYGPLSPRAYVPFGLMPPFARRILDRVLP